MVKLLLRWPGNRLAVAILPACLSRPRKVTSSVP